MAEYQSTTEKHPTNKLLVGKRSGKIQLGKGKVLDVDVGDHARASDTYEGQAGPTKLFAPTGNHSKFALSPQTINKFYKPAATGEKLNIDLRDERGTKPNVQTGGRRSPEEIASAGKPKSKKSRQDDQQDRMRVDKQSENEPMRLAAGDQYDTQDADSLIEQMCALDDDQLDEFLDTLSDEQVELIEQQLEEIKSQQQFNALSEEEQELKPRWTGGPKPVRSQSYYRDRHTHEQNLKGKLSDTPAGERRVRDAVRRNPEMAKELSDTHLGTDGETAVSHKAGRPGEVYMRSLAVQPAQGTARGPGEDKDPVASGVKRGVVDGGEQEITPQTDVGPGLRSRVHAATTGVQVPSRKLARQARTIGASVEHDNNLDQIQENEEQQMNNYVETAINGDAINFSSTIRDALDAHAHAAIEQIKISMLESDDTQDQDGAIDEQVEAIIEQLEQLDEQQLDQYLGELNEQELLQIEQLLDEAKYGTKKGRHRLAMKIRAGKDIGKKGKHFEEIAQKAGKRYGSAERGRAVAAAAMWKRLGGKKSK